MSLPVILRSEASRDVAEIQDYLESQKADLGQDFLDQLNAALVRIGSMPSIYGLVQRNVRAARMRRFTYVVYYRVYNDRIEVLAVMHGSRRVSSWQDRI